MNSNFSERLKELRTTRKIPQTDIADALGISTRAYRFYENGDRFPDFHGIIILADFFNVSTDYILGREKENEIKTIAAHHDSYIWTEDELDEIERFKEFVRTKRTKKDKDNNE